MQIRITEVNPHSTSYDIFPYDKLLSMLGISSLKFDYQNTKFDVLNRSVEFTSDVRVGYQLNLENQITIGRYYYYNSTTQGWGAYSCELLYNLGVLQEGFYSADIYGANYN